MAGPRIFTVYACEWYGGLGWTWDGYCDVTPAGAVANAFHSGRENVTIDSPYDNCVYVNGHTGEVIAGDSKASA